VETNPNPARRKQFEQSLRLIKLDVKAVLQPVTEKADKEPRRRNVQRLCNAGIAQEGYLVQKNGVSDGV
jgi:hypothetical protein